MMEGRDPVGFEGKVFLYAKFHTLVQRQLSMYRVGAVFLNRFRMKMTYTFRRQRDFHDTILAYEAIQKEWVLKNLADWVDDENDWQKRQYVWRSSDWVYHKSEVQYELADEPMPDSVKEIGRAHV